MNKKLVPILLIVLIVPILLIFLINAAMADNILSYWKLDGNNLNDSLGANNGTDSGTANASGIINDGRDFEQTEGDYIDVGSNTIDLTTENFTINAWIKPESLVDSARILAPTTTLGYGVFILDTGVVGFSYFGVNGLYSTDIISNGVWSMVTVVYDQSADLMTFYINGTVDSAGAQAYSSTFSADRTYYIGNGYPVGTTYAWDGIIDEVAVFTRCLSAEEIGTEAETLYNSHAGWAYPFVVDTCTCPGAGNNWEIDMSDYCNITTACDLTTGTLSFTGAGWTNCNASVDTTNLGDPGASGVLYIQDSCLITID